MAFTSKKKQDGLVEEKKGEEEWKGVLRDLTNETKAYQDARKRKDNDVAAQHSERVHQLMLKAAEVHPDPTVKEKFKKDAEEWNKGDNKLKDIMSHPFVQGLAILLAAPFALAGGALFAAGALVYGTGKLIVGLGDALTFGQFRHWTS
ncbi:hypothetical protein QCA50_014218 [Cerrena zonata]|uniref:Uncharacterized protein n=1 Tax=Cerrena zonata TaxID=2478898 RepID=A0AAW0FUU4_9APHY